MICAAGLIGALTGSRKDAVDSLRHPIVLICLGIAVWSMIAAPAARYPILSIVGSPQIADGTMLWFDYALFIAGARLIRDRRGCLYGLGAATACVAITLPVLSAFPITRAIWFNDYLAFLGLAAAIVVPACFRTLLKSQAATMSLGFAVGLPGIIVSQNLTAILAITCLSGPAYVAARLLTATNAPYRIDIARKFFAGAIVAVAIAVPLGVQWLGPKEILKSIQSRAQINDVLLNLFDRDGSIWLVGKGWGHTQQYFAEALAQTNVTIWDRSWDAAWRDIFHSHNLVLEALIAAGIPAAAAILAFVAIAPLTCERDRLPAAAAYCLGYVALASLWFQMPGTAPITAVAFAMLTPDIRRVRPALDRRGATVVLLAAIMVAQMFTVAILANAARGASGVESRLARTEAAHATTPDKCDGFPDGAWRGDIGLALQLVRTIDKIRKIGVDAGQAGNTVGALQFYACAANSRDLENKSRPLLSAGLLLRSQLAYNPTFKPIGFRFANLLENWEIRARNHLILSPDRTDLILPFLSWQLSIGQFNTVTVFVDRILARNARDSVALWFKGMALLRGARASDHDKALNYLRLGIEHGIEKWLPVSDSTKISIGVKH